MVIYPAIDLLDGSCVRLKQGVFTDRKVYSDDPIGMLRNFEEAGATHVHIVDLSGAKDPTRHQRPLISKLVAATKLRIQVGGGLRDLESAHELLRAGADRVVIGSAAISNPDLVMRLLAEVGGGRVTLALDVRLDQSGVAQVATHGWQEQSGMQIAEALVPFSRAGLERVLCTDIGRDGMMQGPNLALYQSLSADFPGLEFQASGGVGTLDHLLALRDGGVRSVVVGKALYEGAIDLKEALQRC